MKISSQFERILQTEIKVGNTVFLAGEPGIGKTSIVKSLAKAMDSECFVVSVNLMADKADLTGARLLPTPDGTSFEQKFFAHHRVREAVDYAKANPNSTVFLLLDEINRSTPDVTSGALSISTERELGDQKLPKNIAVMVTGNVRGNIVALDGASLSRFVLYEVEADAPTLIAHLDNRENGNKPMNKWCRAVLTKNPDTIYEESAPTAFVTVDGDDDDDTVMASADDLADAGEEMRQLTTPRTIEGLSDWLDAADHTLLMEMFQTQVSIGTRDVTMLHEIIEGHVGNTRFSQLLIGEIAGDLSSNATPQSTGPTVPRPGCWDLLQQAGTLDEIDRTIQDLNPRERSSSLVFALYDNNDNRAIIQQLAAQVDQLEAEHNPIVLNLMTSSRVDTGNLRALLDTGSPVSSNIGMIASMAGITV